MDKMLIQNIKEAKELLNSNGYLVFRLGKGQISLATECEVNHYACDSNNCNDCINRRCLNGSIKEQIN